MKRLLKFFKIALLLALISASLERLAKLSNKLLRSVSTRA